MAQSSSSAAKNFRFPGAYSFQRFAAAFRAISARRFLVRVAARAFPPIRPSATAAGFLPSDSGVRL
jgi:hypothetical protein